MSTRRPLEINSLFSDGPVNSFGKLFSVPLRKLSVAATNPHVLMILGAIVPKFIGNMLRVSSNTPPFAEEHVLTPRFPRPQIEHATVEEDAGQLKLSHKALQQGFIPIATAPRELKADDPTVMFHNLGDFKRNTQHVPKLITKALDALSGGISASMHVKTQRLTAARALKGNPQT